MRAIGSYTLLKRDQWPGCVTAVSAIQPRETGAWIFKRTHTVGAADGRCRHASHRFTR